jgi:hypothetical protein
VIGCSFFGSSESGAADLCFRTKETVISVRQVKTGFCQKTQCKPVLVSLSLAGNLDTEIDCFLFTDPLPVKVVQHHNAPSNFW